MKYRQSSGFTLIEVAIVLLVGGLLITMIGAALTNYVKQSEIKTTQQRLDHIDEALQLFLSLHGRYPCPARFNSEPDTVNFGVEITDVGCATVPAAANETVQASGRDSRAVRLGAVPVRTLNLPDDYIRDSWGGRITYAVTESLASPGTYNRDEGAIYVNDGAGNPYVSFPAPGTAHYTLVSHGQNRAGSYSTEGLGRLPCPASARETENCNDDATFVTTTLRGRGDPAHFYDDYVRVRAMTAFGNSVPPGAIMAFNLRACPDGWIPFSGASGRATIGADEVQYPFGSTGGAKQVNLTPSHVPMAATPGRNLDALPSGSTILTTPTAGASTPVNTMMPYIAMTYCEKS